MKRKASPNQGGGDNKKKNKTGDAGVAVKQYNASEAIMTIEKLGEKKVRVVLADGWEHVLPRKGEDDPGSLIMWDDDNVDATVAAFNAALTAVPLPAIPPPAWLNLGGNGVTAPALKASILAHVQTRGGGGRVIGNALIAPNDITQFSNVKTVFSHIGFDAFFRAHAVCPIGYHYVLADRRVNTTAVADAVVTPPVGYGSPVFV